MDEGFWSRPSLVFWFVILPVASFFSCEVFVFYGFWAFLIIGLGVILSALVTQLFFGPRKVSDKLVPIYVTFLLVGVGSCCVWAIWAFATIFYRYVWTPLQPFIIRNHLQNPINFAAGFLLLMIAVLAYKVRCRHRIVYGFAELLFGFCAFIWGIHSVDLFQTFDGHGSGLDLVAAKTFAGLFIIVRGLNSIDEGIKKVPKGNQVVDRILTSVATMIS